MMLRRLGGRDRYYTALRFLPEARQLARGTDALVYALREHASGYTDGDITVQACWDADSLDLGRVGIQPGPALLCTPAARNRALIEQA